MIVRNSHGRAYRSEHRANGVVTRHTMNILEYVVMATILIAGILLILRVTGLLG